MLLASGGLLYWLNTSPNIETFERVEAGEVVSTTRSKSFGWPITWLKQELHTDVRTKETTESAGGYLPLYYGNLAFAIILLWIVAYFGERRAVRLERLTAAKQESADESVS